ncbi:nitrate/nitrite transporter NrtS [Streptomyces ardesiacus]|uniref:nitrate/nitrite transporter NrtS n=1 Tax=Streptomyces ardesiacus TaxID=285564 RepID=UPI0006E1CA55
MSAAMAWSRPGQALALLQRGHTVRTAAPVALLVGTVLSAVNQSDVILSGHAGAGTWIRVAVNFLVPFTVASWGYLSARRVPRIPDGPSPSGAESP